MCKNNGTHSYNRWWAINLKLAFLDTVNNRLKLLAVVSVYCCIHFWYYSTVPLKHNIALTCTSSWLNYCSVKGCGTHFVYKYCWSTSKNGYSQAKWVPHPFSQWLFNHEKINLCERVRHWSWEQYQIYHTCCFSSYKWYSGFGCVVQIIMSPSLDLLVDCHTSWNIFKTKLRSQNTLPDQSPQC